MGKLLLKIRSTGPEPASQEGDIICAVPDSHVFSETEHKHYYVIKVDDFTEVMADILCERFMDNTNLDRPVVLKKRLRKVDWRNDLGLTVDEIKRIDNMGLKVDHTATKSFLRSNVVKVKT